MKENFIFKQVIIFSLFMFSNNGFAEQKFVCKTEKHTVVISLVSDVYQYVAWNKPKSIKEKPDMVVSNGKETIEGTGPCTNTLWTFTKGNVQYVVSTPAACTESQSPPNATGTLDVLINEELKKSWWCVS